MINHLVGKIIDRTPPILVIEVRGVGYELHCPMTTFYQLAEQTIEVKLYTHLAIREDAHVLYGFTSVLARSLFRALIKVNSVGPKLALAVLSGMEPQVLFQCIEDSDVGKLTKLPGVGKKTAERLIIEMRDKCAALMPQRSPSEGHTTVAVVAKNGQKEQAVSALVALGYKTHEASKAVTAIAAEDLPAETLIRLALKSML